MRGRWSGNGLRFGLPFGVSFGSVGDIFANKGLNRPCNIFFLKRQFKLIEGFGPRAEAMAAQARQLMLSFSIR